MLFTAYQLTIFKMGEHFQKSHSSRHEISAISGKIVCAIDAAWKCLEILSAAERFLKMLHVCKCLPLIIYKLFLIYSQFYEPDALLADPADGQIFIELLGKI